MRQHIAIIYSLPSARLLATKYGATDEDTGEIAKMVARGLDARGYPVSTYPIAEDNLEKILEIKADVIFNLIEWCGADIALAERAFDLMAQLNIPVTGSRKDLFVLTGDKIRMKQRLLELGLPTAPYAAFASGSKSIPDTLPYPVIVKPSLEHCSMGLGYDSIAHDARELRSIVARQIGEFEQPVLAEEFIVGREFLVYMVQENTGVKVLPIEEVIFEGKKKYAFQTYETKWDENHEDYNSTDVVVAKLSEEEKLKISELCIETFAKMGFVGYARFDLRMRAGSVYILETNANPSVYDATYEIEDIEEEVIPGILFPDYLDKIVASAKLL